MQIAVDEMENWSMQNCPISSTRKTKRRVNNLLRYTADRQTDRQTDRQINKGKIITSFVKITNHHPDRKNKSFTESDFT